MENINYALVNEGDVILFTSFDKMKKWFTMYASEWYIDTEFDFDFFFTNGYSQVDNCVYWTERVTLVK